MAYGLESGRESELALTHALIEPCQPGQTLKSIRDHFIFHYVISGKGRVRYGCIEYSLVPGNGFLSYPGDLYDYRADIEDPWHIIWCGFLGSSVEDLMSDVGLARDKPVYHARDVERTSVDLKRIVDTMSRSKSRLEIMSCLYGLFHALERHSGRSRLVIASETAPVDYVDAAYMYLRENYWNKECSVESMARRMGLTRGYLATLLRRKTGKTPQELLIGYRLAKARELLASTTLPIYEIAEAVGYSDPLSFSRAFHKWSGLSPSRCRESNYKKATLIPPERAK